MPLTKNDKAMLVLADQHMTEIRATFSPATADQILDALAHAVGAIRAETMAGRDGRDVILAINKCLSEADNVSTLLALKKANTKKSERNW